ncbi:MAG: TspO/MBR family protein [Alphaproteobacteria bacterium]
MDSADGAAPRTRRDWVGLGVSLALVLVVSVVGGLVTADSVEGWYRTLEKPAFNPPDWLFGPVWTLLYVMMAVAAWRVWRRAGWRNGRAALGLYGAQLALNLGWTLLFFGAQRPAWALAELVVLFAAIAVTALAFFRHDRVAALLLAPYAAWVAFAGVLNAAIVWLN